MDEVRVRLVEYLEEKHSEVVYDPEFSELPVEAVALHLLKTLDERVLVAEKKAELLVEAKAQALEPKDGSILLLKGGADDQAHAWFQGVQSMVAEGRLPKGVVACHLPDGMDIEHIPPEEREQFIERLRGAA